MRDGTAKFLSHVHTGLYRATGGRVGRRLVDNDMLLLTTRGRHTGRAHTVPLLYLQDDPHYVVFASWGGRPDHPEWYLNLVADPVGRVQVLGNRITVRARTADHHERARWWPQAVAAYGGYADYQARTNREIPVVFLEGRPSTAILDYVVEQEAGLVVLGSHGHSALGELLIGSTAREVTQRARVPVLLVPIGR